MFIAERNNLTPVRLLVANIKVQLELFENKSGQMFLSSHTITPGGIIYYAITPSLLNAFIENTITLQTLFEQSPSVFMEVVSGEKTALYNVNDAVILLVGGNNTLKQLNQHNTNIPAFQ